MFDQDESGNLNFSEFLQVRHTDSLTDSLTDFKPLASHLTMQANSVKNLDTPQDKLGWMVTFFSFFFKYYLYFLQFDAFDADGGGKVDAEEITSIVVGLFR